MIKLMTDNKTKQQSSLTPTGFSLIKEDDIRKNIRHETKVITRALKPKASNVRRPFIGSQV
jgi:hypothetical protein